MQVNNFSVPSQIEKKDTTIKNPLINSLAIPVENNIIKTKESLEIKNQLSKIQNLISFVPENNNFSDILNNIEKASTQAEKFDLISKTLLENGGKIDTKNGNRNIIAFRNPNLPSENDSRGVYDDVTFIFWEDKDGTKKVERFQSNTDPNGLFTENRPNGDFGRIKSGKTYSFGFSYSQKLGKSLRPIDKLDIERFSPKENKFKDVQTSFTTDQSFLFHHGLEPEDNTYSMGCQTFPIFYDPKTKTSNDTWDTIWATLKGDDKKERQAKIFYTIFQL